MAWPTEQRETTEFGDDHSCWPAGETPLQLIAHFEDIVDCDPDDPPDHGPIPGDVWLTQDPIIPRKFEGGDVDAWWGLFEIYDPGDNKLFMVYDTDNLFFKDFTFGVCSKAFGNDLTCILGHHSEGGTGNVYEGSVPPSVRQLEVMDDLNIDPSLETFYKQWPTDNADKVLRLNNRRLSINVRVKYTP